MNKNKMTKLIFYIQKNIFEIVNNFKNEINIQDEKVKNHHLIGNVDLVR